LIHFYKRGRIELRREMGTPVVLLLGHLVLAGSLSVGADHQAQHLVFAPLLPTDQTNSFVHADRIGEDKRGGGSWKMRMFKRGQDGDEEGVPPALKRGDRDGWQMRMFKKGDDHWRMRMFKRRFVLPDVQEDKRAEGRWKMRMFKRLEAAQHFGKRPDRWQMRMFKREPEMNQEYQGSPLR